MFESWECRPNHQKIRIKNPTARNRSFSISARPCTLQRVASEEFWWSHVTCRGMLPTLKNFHIVIFGDRHTPEVLTSSILRMFLTIPRVFTRAVDARNAPWHAEKNHVRADCRKKTTTNDIAPKGAGRNVVPIIWRRPCMFNDLVFILHADGNFSGHILFMYSAGRSAKMFLIVIAMF